MNTKAKQELNVKTKEELQTLIRQAKTQLFTLRLEKSQKKLKNLILITRKRKDIARLETILNQKDSLGGNV